MIDYSDLARIVMARCDELGNVSQSETYLDRRYLSEQHKQANKLVAGWMTDAGMNTRQDQAGNLWGRYESDNPNAPRLLMGSHLDTVPNGGKYDGMLGVITPISLVTIFNALGQRLPFHLDIVGFGDEEGTRFGSTLLGSRALTGSWPAEWASLKDENGIRLPQAMEDFGLSFANVHTASIADSETLAYIELHIEQGPVLEQKNLPVGTVTAIAGARRFQIHVNGMAGHAGTVPMPLRKDALAASAEMILAVEAHAAKQNVVATVGKIDNRPNGVNVISGNTTFSLDIRSENDAHRDAVVEQIMQSFALIAAKRGVEFTTEQTHAAPAVGCDKHLQDALISATRKTGIEPFLLPSGAGHDAMAIADLCPVAMLFMRCDKGISHHPAEAILGQDVEVVLQVLHHTIADLAQL